MRTQHEKMMADLNRLVEKQNFESEEDLKKFLDQIIGQKIPSLSKEKLSSKEIAQDLVFEAYELTPSKAKTNIQRALQLDPDCIEAYEFLAFKQEIAEIACVFFEKGISIGRRFFGGKYLKENKGRFWGIHETRPFMRCLHQYADCIYNMGKVEECVAIFEEMIELNPNDNQGARDQLMLFLIQLNQDKKFLKYSKMFGIEDKAFYLFNHALFAFKTEGETEHSNKQLSEALKQNKHVAKILLSNKVISGFPSYYGMGDENEAEYYAIFAQHVWSMTKGAIEWLKKHSTKSNLKKL